jgi:hypothetical protein
MNIITSSLFTDKSPDNALATLHRGHSRLLLAQLPRFTASSGGDDDDDPAVLESSVRSSRLADSLFAPNVSSSSRNIDCIKKWTPTIEISPGFCVRLRGAEDTWSCIEVDFFSTLHLSSVSGGHLRHSRCFVVLCPVCRVASPMEGILESNGGVGLGFTIDDLIKWQNEILLKRKARNGR